MYLKVEPSADGSMRAFLKNPSEHRRFTRIAALERAGDVVRLLPRPRAARRDRYWRGGTARRLLSIPLRRGTYDFQHIDAKAASDFYPRSRPGIGSAYAYVPAAARLDLYIRPLDMSCNSKESKNHCHRPFTRHTV